MVFGPFTVEIRPIRMSDCSQEWCDWLNNPKVNSFLETRHTRWTLAKIRDYAERIIRSDDQYMFAITANAKHVGNIKLGPVNRIHSHAQISYLIGNTEYWKRGIATQAIALICDYGFNTLGLHRLEAGFYNDNAGSRAALVKCGFSEDGVLHRQLKDDAGMWCDHVLMGLLVDDWKNMTGKK